MTYFKTCKNNRPIHKFGLKWLRTSFCFMLLTYRYNVVWQILTVCVLLLLLFLKKYVFYISSWKQMYYPKAMHAAKRNQYYLGKIAPYASRPD